MNYQHKTRSDNSLHLDYLPMDKVKLGNSPIHGRGVFASKNIKRGEVVERCPLVQMQYRSRYQNDPTVFDYMYAQPPCDCIECQTHGFLFFMVLGYGMLYNHQDHSNALWKFHYHQMFGDVVAITDIKEGDEIFVSYGKSYFSNDKIDTGKVQKKISDFNANTQK